MLMQPQQPDQQPSNSGNPYDFIMRSPAEKPRGLKGALTSGSKAVRAAIFGGGAIIILLLAIVLFSILGGSNANVEALSNLASQQNEILEIADIGAEKANDAVTKNLAVTVKLAVTDSQNDTLELLDKAGGGLKKNELAKLSADLTSQLESADASGNFDDTFTKLLTEKLSAYRVSVQNAYKLSESSGEKQLLQNSFNGVNQLLGEQTPS